MRTWKNIVSFFHIYIRFYKTRFKKKCFLSLVISIKVSTIKKEENEENKQRLFPYVKRTKGDKNRSWHVAWAQIHVILKNDMTLKYATIKMFKEKTTSNHKDPRKQIYGWKTVTCILGTRTHNVIDKGSKP